MKTLSPKKYIETKVRNLPIHKCLITPQWQELKMANVIVMRRHVNGNITAGMYMIDLLCLGIKDTHYIFNETEWHISQRFPDEKYLKETDYTTAHNVIYAGHDFAMDYDIKPHKDFAITKYILEEDNDKIPLIDVEVGDDEGLPHLMVDELSKYADALAKLKKNAGEGNYHLTIGEGEYDEDDEEEDISAFLDDHELGTLTPLTAQYILGEDFADEKKVNLRTPTEIAVINTEVNLRILRSLEPDYFYEENTEQRTEYEFIENAGEVPDGMTLQNMDELKEVLNTVADFLEDPEKTETAIHNFFIDLLKRNSHNPLVLSNIFELAILQNRKPLIPIAESYLQKLTSQFPLATLSLALAALVQSVSDIRYQYIYKQADASLVFGKTRQWSTSELNTFWLIQVLVHLKRNDLKNAIHYYQLAAETEGVFNWLSFYIQFALIETIRKVLKLENAAVD